MFVSASVAVDVPLGVAQHRLLEWLHRGDLEALASASYGEGVSVLARAGVPGLSKTVAILSIPAYQRGLTTVVPLRWVATGGLGSAFPVFDANLEMTAGEAGTELVIVGAYRPPLGVIGAAIDRMVLHGVAQSTVRRFAAQLGEVAAGTHPAPAASSRLPLTSEGEGQPVS